MKKKILITGGAGFIGSHLCEFLSKDCTLEVFSLDNYSTGSEENHFNNVNYIKGNTKDIDKLIDFDIDIVYHLGEYSRVEQSFEDTKVVWESNKNGTFAVLEFVRKRKCKLLYAGSSTKFGDGGLGRSASPYAWTKASNTELVRNYGNWFNIDYAIVYFYNVYGKREISKGKYATLIGIFKEKMKNNSPLPVVSPGTQIRNFTHIDDIIKGLILVGNFGYGDEYGIGNKKSYSVLEVAKMFKDDIQMLSQRKGNRMSSVINTKKIESLGWSAQVDLSSYINTLRENNWEDL
ncbi:ADP-L-glycero-D-manno-heptose-6-epimerase [Malaciobacter halophilus]|uniref:ADP-L-glycero-D-manno-heptose-6-epimerase n=1 Tax=Malaciobacter halophilus TaxID=197482 RepID=A0A2N1IZD3_9BACT|nr:NAD-dependent epimerase/dehydratase family protein [Malaciobacter halophilus]AXH09639.1 NAD-dependent epimerase/dehydratase (DUF1731 domain) [Malaciobacter halophilus]PKI79658.1 ADP-L-glycero-D-manno-heptose-6-epimerase [Malaciobacter halophilus]